MKHLFFTAALLLWGIFNAAAGDNMPEDTGVASYYGDEFIGRKTASGELYKAEAYTAAHRTLPLGTRLLVTNLDNGKKVVVKVNDRGPFVKGRLVDLSRAAAEKIGLIPTGTAKVSIQAIPFDKEIPDEEPVAPKAPASETPPAPAIPAVAPAKPAPSPASPPAEEPSKAKTVPLAPDTEPVIQGFVKNAPFIQVGAFKGEDNARLMAGYLSKEGFSPRIKEDGGIWRIFLQAANDNEADSLLKKLVKNGHKTFLQLKNEPQGHEVKLTTN